MKKRKTRLLAVLLMLCMSLGLCACGGVREKDVITLVQGNIEEIYQGKLDPRYLRMVDRTAEEAKQAYLAGLEKEAEYFAYYWGILDADLGEIYTDLDESLRQDITALYQEIYRYLGYEIVSATWQGEGSYTVKVQVEPVDVMEQAKEIYQSGSYEPLNAFWKYYEDTDFAAMSSETYMDYTNSYGKIVLQLVREQLPNLGYKEQKTLSIRVEADEEGILKIHEEDWKAFDSCVIDYS